MQQPVDGHPLPLLLAVRRDVLGTRTFGQVRVEHSPLLHLRVAESVLLCVCDIRGEGSFLESQDTAIKEIKREV